MNRLVPRHCLVLLLIIAPPSPAIRADDTMVGGLPVNRAVVCARPELPAIADIDAPMTRALGGVLLWLDEAEVPRLASCLRRGESATTPDEAEPICFIRLRCAEADHVFAVRSGGDGQYVMRGAGESDAEESMALDAERFDELMRDARAYRGRFDEHPEDLLLQQDFVMDPPYAASSIFLDEETQGLRLFRDKASNIEPQGRSLDEAVFHVRLPAGYSPRRPAGLLVWCSPVPQGWIPRSFTAALDELGLIGVGVENAGNHRAFVERAQLMFDVAETAQRRYHVDPDRIYLTGMSGGGRVTAALGICFPDVFRGTVPIVGFSSYSRLRNVRAFFSKPRGELLARARTMRMAMMSGPPDFNYPEMMERKRRLERDGFEGIRMFEYPDMAHVMPTPQRFLEALGWVDEPYRAARHERDERAGTMLEAYLEGRDDPRPVSDEDRAALIEIIRIGSWSAASWRALECLGVETTTAP